MTNKIIFVISMLLSQQILAIEIQEFHFAFISDSNSSALSGAEQGISEANLQGQFLGKKYTLEKFSTADLDKIQTNRYVAILTALPAKQLLSVSSAINTHAVFNLTAKDNDLRQSCSPNLLHTIGSSKMYEDAKQQWLQKKPDAKITVSGWHPDFVKFAARDLNKRYKKAFSQAMDEQAWSGWAAVKMTSDLIARGIDTKPASILNILKTELAFDGQKGINMNFRPNGQLRQILLIADDSGKLLGEAPVRGVVDPGDLDSLGHVNCQ